MKIVSNLKKAVKKNTDINNVLIEIEKLCKEDIKGIIEDGYRYETYVNNSMLHIGICREYSTEKTGEEYLQIFVDLTYKLKDSNLSFSQNYDLFSGDDDFDLDNFIEHIKNSDEYKYVVDNDLKAIECNCGVNET